MVQALVEVGAELGLEGLQVGIVAMPPQVAELRPGLVAQLGQQAGILVQWSVGLRVIWFPQQVW